MHKIIVNKGASVLILSKTKSMVFSELAVFEPWDVLKVKDKNIITTIVCIS